jgi:pullulanase
LRKTFPAFRRAEYENITFFKIYDNDFALGYQLKFDIDEFIVLLNAAQKVNEEFKLPEGNWDILVNSSKAGIEKLGEANGKIVVNPVNGYVLKKRK